MDIRNIAIIARRAVRAEPAGRRGQTKESAR
jgi:hypothetical protein